MKIEIFDYCNTCKDLLSKIGLHHKQIIVVDETAEWMMHVQDCLDNGMTIMIETLPNTATANLVLFVDKNGKRFRQR